MFGKIHFTNNERNVYGVGTAFTKQVSNGDVITVAGQGVSVLSVDSDSKLTVARPLVGDYEANTAQPWTREWQYANYFSSEPATSNHIRLTNGDLSAHHNDQLHVVVVDEGGRITGINITETGLGYVEPPEIAIYGIGKDAEFLVNIDTSVNSPTYSQIDPENRQKIEND